MAGTRVSSYNRSTYIEDEFLTIPASGATAVGMAPEKPGNTQIAIVRFVKNASQTGGTTPIGYFNLNGIDADSQDMPIYDGDLWEFYESDISDFRVNSSDANTPTACVHYYRAT